MEYEIQHPGIDHVREMRRRYFCRIFRNAGKACMQSVRAPSRKTVPATTAGIATLAFFAGVAWMLFASATAVAQGVARDAATVRATALLAYEASHYADAVAQFERAAALGDQRSAEALALMYRFGGAFYGTQVPADPAAAARWAQTAADMIRAQSGVIAASR